jgi:hypothetical protein
MIAEPETLEEKPPLSKEFSLERERDAKFNEWLQKKSLRDKSFEVMIFITLIIM